MNIWVSINRGIGPIRAAKIAYTRCKNGKNAYNTRDWPCTGLITNVLGIRVCEKSVCACACECEIMSVHACVCVHVHVSVRS